MEIQEGSELLGIPVWEDYKSHIAGTLAREDTDNDTDCFGAISGPVALFTELYFQDGSYAERFDEHGTHLVGLGVQTGHVMLAEQVSSWRNVQTRITYNYWTGEVVDEYQRPGSPEIQCERI